MKSYEEIKPTILIYYDDDHMVKMPLRKIREGLEEEGVPWEEKVITGSVQNLARQAAEDSRIGIGIGLLSDGTCLLVHKRLLAGNPIMKIIPGAQIMENYRTLGSNAARMAKNIPLKWF